MINNNIKNKEGLFKCPECNFDYKEESWAKKCETWCKEYKSCNVEITKHAIEAGH